MTSELTIVKWSKGYEIKKNNLDQTIEQIVDQFQKLEPKFSTDVNVLAEIETLIVSVTSFMESLETFLRENDYPYLQSHLKLQKKYIDRAHQIRKSHEISLSEFIVFFQSWWKEMISREGRLIKEHYL